VATTKNINTLIQGTAISPFGASSSYMWNSSTIGRIGVLSYGTGLTGRQYLRTLARVTTASSRLQYSGYWCGNRHIVVKHNVITNNRGVASCDKSWSQCTTENRLLLRLWTTAQVAWRLTIINADTSRAELTGNTFFLEIVVRSCSLVWLLRESQCDCW
jgi:hypothetical protein